MRLLVMITALALPAVAQPPLALVQTGNPPGRFAPLDAGQAERIAVNGTYSLHLEKVLKVQALVPVARAGRFGASVYAGALAVAAPDGTWGHALPVDRRRAEVRWLDADLCRAGLTHVKAGWSVQTSAELSTDDPRIRFEIDRLAGAEPLNAALLGYSWAERAAPRLWQVDGRPLTRPAAAVAAPRLLMAYDEAGFTQVLSFTPAPAELRIEDDGLSWSYGASVAHAALVYAVLPGRVDAATAQAFLAAAPRTHLLFADDRPDVELRGAGQLLVPPSLAPLAPATAPRVACVTGDLALVDGPVWRAGLPSPPGLGRVLPEWRPLSAEAAAHLARQTEAVLSRQRPDGTFPFNDGRCFHEGTTLAVLCEVAPLLPDALQTRLREAVERGLRYQWGHFVPIGQRPWDLMPPEQPGFVGAGIDYPEILACLLQATLLHSRRWDVDPLVPQGVLAAQVRQLAAYMDRSGIALANPGPTFHHLIAESAIGGYLAWQALAHLSYGGQPAPWRGEALSRAAYAEQAWRTLFGCRTVFDSPNAVVNGIERGTIELSRAEPWVYVQSTWFTHLPCLELPRADLFGVWRELARQPWQEWTGKLGSTQRAYDAANAIALARAGRGDEVRRLWPAIVTRPYVWDTFDQAPLLELAATAWLAATP
ncbi:MAG: hypothetical protein HZB16_03855 [Armatimonadetes bacterium]|nr:hypothetical protein [Armatimonadota bacterium]